MPSILAIDDSLTVRKLIDLILGDAGFDVVLADRGEIGLKLAHDVRPDLILLDYILPDRPSPEICQELLDDPNTKDIPILMISTNGGAIRQLYADSPNVKDYLTKPFQAKVLLAVVQNLLGVTPPAAAVAPAPVTPPPAPVAPTTASRPPMLRVPAAPMIETTPPIPRYQPKLTPKAKSGATRPPMASATRPPLATGSNRTEGASGATEGRSGETQKAMRGLLNARFRELARMVPEWEKRRGNQAAETYYLPLLLRHELLAEIAAETERGQLAAERTPLIAGTSDWMSVDATLFHLGRTAATGVFSLRLPDETVDLRLARGRVVAVHSNDPRRYCAGAAFQFRSLPTAVIAAAVAAQQRDGTPFFLTVHRMGRLNDPGTLIDLLRSQGVKAMLRALTASGVRYSFVARELAPESRRFSLDQSVPSFIFEVLRGVDDWLEIETITGSGDTVYALVPEAEGTLASLGMTATEEELVARLDGQLSLEDAAAATNLGLYEVSALIYRLVKLGLVRVMAVANPATDTAEVEAFLRAADGVKDRDDETDSKTEVESS